MSNQEIAKIYRQQMSEIETQLAEKNEYHGAVIDKQSGEMIERTLSRKEALKYVDFLWSEADRLDGYELSDRHQKNRFLSILAAIGRGIKYLFNPSYRKRVKAATELALQQQAYESAMGASGVVQAGKGASDAKEDLLFESQGEKATSKETSRKTEKNIDPASKNPFDQSSRQTGGQTADIPAPSIPPATTIDKNKEALDQLVSSLREKNPNEPEVKIYQLAMQKKFYLIGSIPKEFLTDEVIREAAETAVRVDKIKNKEESNLTIDKALRRFVSKGVPEAAKLFSQDYLTATQIASLILTNPESIKYLNISEDRILNDKTISLYKTFAKKEHPLSQTLSILKDISLDNDLTTKFYQQVVSSIEEKELQEDPGLSVYIMIDNTRSNSMGVPIQEESEQAGNPIMEGQFEPQECANEPYLSGIEDMPSPSIISEQPGDVFGEGMDSFSFDGNRQQGQSLPEQESSQKVAEPERKEAKQKKEVSFEKLLKKNEDISSRYGFCKESVEDIITGMDKEAATEVIVERFIEQYPDNTPKLIDILGESDRLTIQEAALAVIGNFSCMENIPENEAFNTEHLSETICDILIQDSTNPKNGRVSFEEIYEFTDKDPGKYERLAEIQESVKSRALEFEEVEKNLHPELYASFKKARDVTEIGEDL